MPLSSQPAAELQNGKTTHANFIEEIPSVFFTERRLYHKGCIHFTHMAKKKTQFWFSEHTSLFIWEKNERNIEGGLNVELNLLRH